MRIRSVEVETLAIPFREPLVSAAHRWQVRRVALVTIHTDAGIEGLAEFAAPHPDDPAGEVGPRLVAELEGVHLGDPVTLEGALRRIDAWPFVGRVVRSAVESAIVDLLARAGGRSVAEYLAPSPSAEVEVNGLVGKSAPASAAEAALALVGAGYRCLKLKAGDEPPSDLRDRLAAVREVAGTDVTLRLDFNGALDVRSAAEVLDQLSGRGLEYIEQPIAASAGIEALARLRRRSTVPLAADESLRDLGSAREMLEAEAVDVLVVKPARVGGLRQARSIVELAADAGVPVTVSTLFETGVGIAAALHLAATVPGGRAHGLATADLLETDLLTSPLAIAGGHMAVPSAAGLGIELDPVAIERYRLP